MPILRNSLIILSFIAASLLALYSGVTAGGQDTASIARMLREGRKLHYSHPDSALFIYNQIIESFQKSKPAAPDEISKPDTGYLLNVINAYNYTGDIYYFNDEYTRSEYYYQRSLELALDAGLDDRAAWAMYDVGYVRYKSNDYHSAETYFANAYNVFARTGNQSGMFEAGNARGLNFRRLGNFDKADSCYRHCLGMAISLNDSLMIADVKVNLGILLCEKGELDEGIRMFEDALGHYEQINNKKSISLALLNIGVVMKMVEEYDKALAYISQSASIEELLQQKSQLVVRYYNLADLYLDMGELDHAFEYCQKIQSVANEIGSQPFQSECNFLLGKFYYLNNDLVKANDFLEEASDAASNSQHKPLLANIYLMHARTKLKAGEYRKAIELATRAYSLADETQLLMVRKDAAKVLAEAYEKVADHRESLSWYKTFLSHSDSLSYFNQLREISRIEARYNYEKKEKENELLRNRTSLQEQKLKNRSITTIALLSGVAMSLIIIVLLFKRNRDAKLLYEQQQLLNLQHLEEIEGELDGKKRELASKMLFLNQKNELITRLIKRLQEIQQSDDHSSEELISIVNELRVDAPQTNWKEFEMQFTQVHPGFYQRLYEKHPELTSYEQRICAFLRMNLNTKEISAITGRSAKSIEVTRSRIRTKLKLTRNDNLSSFLAAI
jgi:tetratricopeptide (TPR) repeat protein